MTKPAGRNTTGKSIRADGDSSGSDSEEQLLPARKRRQRGTLGSTSTAASGKSTQRNAVAALQKPRGATNAYMHFANFKRADLREANPQATLGELGKLSGELWRRMSTEDREPWMKRAAEDKARYVSELAEFRLQYPERVLAERVRPSRETSVPTPIRKEQKLLELAQGAQARRVQKLEEAERDKHFYRTILIQTETERQASRNEGLGDLLALLQKGNAEKAAAKAAAAAPLHNSNLDDEDGVEDGEDGEEGEEGEDDREDEIEADTDADETHEPKSLMESSVTTPGFCNGHCGDSNDCASNGSGTISSDNGSGWERDGHENSVDGAVDSSLLPASAETVEPVPERVDELIAEPALSAKPAAIPEATAAAEGSDAATREAPSVESSAAGAIPVEALAQPNTSAKDGAANFSNGAGAAGEMKAAPIRKAKRMMLSATMMKPKAKLSELSEQADA
mmetsp:Transcript_18845/g.31520  ORF Transcript_18845/g.31520 Transcript_18845/m.31520 type:complete len:453 (-) Transcript_18845:218-1576(-)|eukprot:CAMPEP_0119330606 /NCGR_PEP_ID=MMETSP1333-20130426/78593_1 /TAXON_ID=418940 /ORGANISM="Scyphosphaera apsteinii, Strain RCC1455" /LENGTH=452 /DNA_ID=CAMNT_0007340011 /DNA_START=140 /DNA_END=1498 /DNA_ORIENTATION=-